ncbi:MAG: response regulator transcription factor [Pleomorphochaeta sp.]
MNVKYLINYKNKRDLHLLRKLALYSSIYDNCIFVKETLNNCYENYDISIFVTHDLLSLVKLKAFFKKNADLKFIILADGENMSILTTLSEDNFIVLELNCKTKVFKENIIYLHPQVALSIKITKREKQILGLILKGENNNQIANLLGVSERTVEAHRRNIYIKTGVHSITQLTLWAINNNMFNN